MTRGIPLATVSCSSKTEAALSFPSARCCCCCAPRRLNATAQIQTGAEQTQKSPPRPSHPWIDQSGADHLSFDGGSRSRRFAGFNFKISIPLPRCRRTTSLRSHDERKLLLKWRCNLFAQPTKETREQTQKEIKKPQSKLPKERAKCRYRSVK
jgi:hypothetical protein